MLQDIPGYAVAGDTATTNEYHDFVNENDHFRTLLKI